MARFLKPPNLNKAVAFVHIHLDQTVDLALAEPLTGPGGPLLAVYPSNDPIAEVIPAAAQQSVGNDGLSRFRVRGKQLGTCMLYARSNGRDGALWGETQVIVEPVSATTAAEKQVRQLFDDGKITFSSLPARTGFEQALNHDKVGGVEASHTLPLLQAMIALTSSKGSLQLLRTFAFKDGPNSPHGPPSNVCSAMDIVGFGAFLFEYHVAKELLIAGVAELISAMPSDINFDLGLVRPVGGAGGFDPRLDVFFTVNEENVRPLERDAQGKVIPGQPPSAVSPGTGWGFEKMLPDAKRAIALAKTGKRLGYVYPDGSNHVHLKAY